MRGSAERAELQNLPQQPQFARRQIPELRIRQPFDRAAHAGDRLGIERVHMRHEQDREAERVKKGAERFHTCLSPPCAQRFMDDSAQVSC
jgi:hypothetical protein